MDELINCITSLHSKGFNVKACVCDNHPTKASAYQKILSLCGKDEDYPIYLFYEAVHLIKNIRNNLFYQKRLVFPLFLSNILGDKAVEVKGDEIIWSLPHKVWEKDMECQANLRAAPKLQTKLMSFILETVHKSFMLLKPSSTLLSNEA